MRKVQARFTLDPDLLAWLQAEADRRRVSMSLIIREWIIREQESRKS